MTFDLSPEFLRLTLAAIDANRLYHGPLIGIEPPTEVILHQRFAHDLFDRHIRQHEALTKIVASEEAALRGDPTAVLRLTGWVGATDMRPQIYAWVAGEALK